MIEISIRSGLVYAQADRTTPRLGRYRAWLGQSQQRYFESEDGLRFAEPPGSLDEPPGPRTLRWAAQLGADGKLTDARRADKATYDWWGQLGRGMTVERNVRQETFTVMRDDAAPPEERYKAAFTCDAEYGHAPYPPFWKYRERQPPPRREWLAAPWFHGEKVYQHGQSAPSVEPQLAPCASPGRAWRLGAAQYSQSEAQPLGAQPPPRAPKRAACKVAGFTAFDHLG